MTGSMKGQTYADKEKYPMRVRIGSGDQYWRNEQDKGTQVAEAYGYLIAGIPICKLVQEMEMLV